MDVHYVHEMGIPRADEQKSRALIVALKRECGLTGTKDACKQGVPGKVVYLIFNLLQHLLIHNQLQLVRFCCFFFNHFFLELKRFPLLWNL